jgi:hypothetical protein
VLAAPTPPAATAAAAIADPSAVATVNPAAENAAMLTTRPIPTTRPCRRSVSLSPGSRKESSARTGRSIALKF